MDDTVTALGRSRVARITGIGAALLLGVVTVWAYLPILDNGFVWDDGANLIGARARWDGGTSGLVWAFTVPFNGHYQPLTWLSYRLDAWLSGATPRGVHLTNLVLHLLATLLVGALAWWFAAHLRRAPPHADGAALPTTAALLSAALFALHPIHVETVAWATERRDVLSTVLVLAAVLLHLRTAPADASPSRSRFAVAALHAAAALARAQMSLPFVLLALDLWPLGRASVIEGRRPLLRLVGEKSLSFAIAAASAAAALWAQASSGALTAASEHGLLDRLVQTGFSFAFYPAALFYRSSRLPLYERPAPFDPLAAPYLLPALAAFAVIAGIWALRRRFPALATAAASYLLFVLPVSGLAQSGIQLVAERYAYLATVPLLLLVGGFAAERSRNLARPSAKALALIAVLVLAGFAAAATHRQARVWRDDETLWRHVLDHSGSGLADNNLGQILLARGERGPALHHLVRALERLPLYPRPWRAIVAILESPDAADAPPTEWVATTLERAAALQPGSTVANYASALAWREAGDPARAKTRLRRVLAREPGHEGARLALAALAAISTTAGDGGEVSAPAPPTPP